MKEAVPGDAGVVDQNVHGPDLALDLFDPGRAGVEVAHIPLEHRDAGLALELVRGLVVAAVIRGDLEPLLLEPLRDRGADAAGAAGDECDACH